MHKRAIRNISATLCFFLVTSLFSSHLLAETSAAHPPSAGNSLPAQPIIRSRTEVSLQQRLDEAIQKKLAEKRKKDAEAIVGPPLPKLPARLRIPAIFDQAGEFHKGSAPVRMGEKWGLIDTNGDWVLAPTFNEIGRYSEEGLLPVKSGDKYGYINHRGTEVIDFIYDDAKPFSDGLAAVKTEEGWGYILPDGKVYLKAGFEDAGSFKQNIAPVKYVGWGYAYRSWSPGKKGKDWLLQPFNEKTYEFSEGFGVFQKNGLMGLVDEQKTIRIKPRFLALKKCSEGLLPASKKQGEWGFVDTDGKTVIEAVYQAAFSFSEGLANVKKAGKWGYINKNNEVVIPFKYDRAYGFRNGVAVVVEGKDRFFIDTEGNPVSDRFADVYRASEGYAAVKVNGKWGYIFIPPSIVHKAEEEQGSEPESDISL